MLPYSGGDLIQAVEQSAVDYLQQNGCLLSATTVRRALKVGRLLHLAKLL